MNAGKQVRKENDYLLWLFETLAVYGERRKTYVRRPPPPPFVRTSKSLIYNWIKMRNAPINLIELDAKGHLQIYPDVNSSGDFKFIYRDASGVIWNETRQALVANEPDRWEPNRLFGQIICSVINEYGIKLEIIDTTKWSNISDELKVALIKAANDVYTMFGTSN